MKRVAIDLTPLLPGGDNGGIKSLAVDLVRHLAALAPDCEFVLLTAEKSHAELAALETSNVRRVCVSQPESAPTLSLRQALTVRRLLLKLLPQSAVDRIGALYARLFHRIDQMPTESPLLRRLGAELLFCPFTGIFFFDPTIPVVSVVADLQYLYYPQFFSPEARHERDRHFRHICRVASRVVCISEYTRRTVLEQSELPADRTAVVWIAAQQRLARADRSVADRVLERLALRPGEYLLYPANFWRHKNHEILLTAFGMYRARHSQSTWKLVLTGATSPRRTELVEAARRMGLAERVTFAGFLPDDELAALLENCTAMLFPSLFEGFGMPVLEAMAAGVPALSGNLTCLPEIAGDAALLFDPRRPQEIVDAIDRLESDPALRATLIEKGRQRAQSLPGPREMAVRYWEIFQEAVRHPADRQPAIYGVFSDGWTSDRITVVFGDGSGPRKLVIKLKSPDWLPAAVVFIRVGADVYRLARGKEVIITRELPRQAGTVELLCSPTFQPSQSGSGDFRSLGCMLDSATIHGADGGTLQLPIEAHAA